jgi:hypothetical protein
MVQVTGSLFTAGKPAVGMIEFRSPSRVVYVDEQATELPSLWTTTLVDGSIPLGFELPANDQGNPINSTYQVTERIKGLTHLRPYNIQLLSTNGSTQDLSELAQVGMNPGVIIGVKVEDLGDAAFLDVGTTAGTVAAGNDPRLSTFYTHIQTTPSASWTVVHGLNRYVIANVYVDGAVGLADVEHIDLNTLAITFAESLSGVAAIR